MTGCEIPQFSASSDEIEKILKNSKTIAVIGLSPKPERPSNSIYQYLKHHGYNVFGVNPGHDIILGDKVYASLMDVPGPVDIVDIFRTPDAVPGIVEEAIKKRAKVVWMQEGIVHNEAASRAAGAGLKVIMNKCIYKEHRAHHI